MADIQVIYVLANINPSQEIAIFVINLILCIYNFAGFGFVAVLISFHTYLINQNFTTVEFCNDIWVDASGNPYSK